MFKWHIFYSDYGYLILETNTYMNKQVVVLYILVMF